MDQLREVPSAEIYSRTGRLLKAARLDFLGGIPPKFEH